ncbi:MULTISPECIES: hypothetical protein [unclassified Pseudobutyrivibrio]|jgi:prefoldin subunit 5|uniref:hypothetical protein n=1 Tax=unclassified Pseudobutyrivibrio TaxID=2638619 RepID=UPI0008829F86|nr:MULTISPECIES: hypothetical protein [unclassified Pseudobutyrivibrio]MBE5904760.1 hypothetical protein [Pseudobutyrivibrio sp.]SCY38281.1 hypothetical protein SAMN05660668_02438 [Pseudobutyrivibrio sp. AR14]
MGISELRARIDSNNAEIEEIKKDITAMETAIKVVSRYAVEFQNQKKTAEEYDISYKDKWKEDLCVDAKDYQAKVVEGIDGAITSCGTAVSDINTCIENARKRIKELQDDNAWCEAEIKRIEEEERRAAEDRKNHPERYQCG